MKRKTTRFTTADITLNISMLLGACGDAWTLTAWMSSTTGLMPTVHEPRSVFVQMRRCERRRPSLWRTLFF